MKRIHVKQALHFSFRGKVFNFAPKRFYEVEDDVANHRFIKRYTLSCEDVSDIPRNVVKVKYETEALAEDVMPEVSEKPKAKRTYTRKKKAE